GKLVRDDDGQPITVQRYSDKLLLALMNARRPPPRERSVRFQLPALRSTADAADAMAAIAAAVASGVLTPGEAAELSRLVDAYTSIKIPKYKYVALDFVSWVRCGKRRVGDWIGGSSGSASPGDCAAG